MLSWRNPAPLPQPASAEGVVLPFAVPGDNAALVDALLSEHRGAKAVFFQRYAKLVERIITHVLGFDLELKDIVQEVFAGALASIHTLKDPIALDAWVARVAALTARKVLRGRSRRAWVRRFVDDTERERYEPVVAEPDVQGRRALRAVYAVLGRLPVDERIAFALRYIDGMTLQETAAACGVSLATIKRRVARAGRRFVANARNHPDLSHWVRGGLRWDAH